MAAISCNNPNPLIEGWNTPYGIPDFGAVKEEHYIPAFEAGIAQQQAEIDAIITNEEAPTFANVVEAYEKSGAILDRAVGVLFNLSETDSTPALQEIVEQVLPMISVHSDNIFMNATFSRIYRRNFCDKIYTFIAPRTILGTSERNKLHILSTHTTPPHSSFLS